MRTDGQRWAGDDCGLVDWPPTQPLLLAMATALLLMCPPHRKLKKEEIQKYYDIKEKLGTSVELHTTEGGGGRCTVPLSWLVAVFALTPTPYRALRRCLVSPSGSFAVVKRAVRKSDGKQFAIKVIKKSKLNSEELAVVHDEVEIMHKVRNMDVHTGAWCRGGAVGVHALVAFEC